MMFVKPKKELFFSRKDKNDKRFGEIVGRWTNEKDLTKLFSCDVAILGIPDDRGIIKNGGRSGAARGPEAVRKKFYTFTPGWENRIDKLKISDLGDMRIVSDLEKTRRIVEEAIFEITKKGIIPIIIGGGHDFAYPDILGFIRGHLTESQKAGNNFRQTKFGRINVDAHLDVRDLSFGITSGTAFFETLESAGSSISGENFVEFGAQECHNSKFHRDYLKKRGAAIFALDEIRKRGFASCWELALKIANKNVAATALSIDIDVVKASEAPGASASYPNGLSSQELEEIAYSAGRNKKIQMLDIFEISPPFDINDQTAALGASILFYFLKGLAERKKYGKL